MSYVVLKAKIIEDNSMIPQEIQTILTEDGVLTPLIDFFLDRIGLSESWRTRTVQAAGLMLDFIEANQDVFDDPQEMFKVFVKRLWHGTIGEDGTDPSGLYWHARKRQDAGFLVSRLSELSDFMADKLGTVQINPFRCATSHEEMLNLAAYQHRKSRAFLAHLWTAELAGSKGTRKSWVKGDSNSTMVSTYNFPEDRIFELLFKGFALPGKKIGAPLYERFNLRNILITILMHGGGLRHSEPFHLYVQDVTEDPIYEGRALVRIYHPEEGAAPLDLLDRKGNPVKCHREKYLREKFGLKPRNQYLKSNRLHAGWKDPLLNDNTQKYMQVFWFSSFWGELFYQLWGIYMEQLAMVERDNPYAFVNFHGPNIGSPYALGSFSKSTNEGAEKGAHAAAVKKIGLIPAKNQGTTDHGHRHSYCKRVDDAGLHEKINMVAMHHKSIESQLKYGIPTVVEVTKTMNEASRQLDAGKTAQILQDMTMYGFKDVDPLGLFSGPYPKLKGKF